MVSSRMELRLDKELKAKIEKASALTGAKSTTEYVLSVMEKEATKDIARHSRITVENDLFDRFIKACKNAAAPNKALRDAANYTRDQGIR